MAMSLNRAQLIGNVTRDPEVRQIPGGTTVSFFQHCDQFCLERCERPEAGESRISQHCGLEKPCRNRRPVYPQGQQGLCRGRIQTRDWEGEDGVKALQDGDRRRQHHYA